MTEELKGATKRKNQKLEEYQSGKQAEKAGDYEKLRAAELKWHEEGRAILQNET